MKICFEKFSHKNQDSHNNSHKDLYWIQGEMLNSSCQQAYSQDLNQSYTVYTIATVPQAPP